MFQLVEGEFFTDSDPEDLVVITESTAKLLNLKQLLGEKISVYTVKGVVKDIHNSLPTLPPKPILFITKGSFPYNPNNLIFSYEGTNWEVIKERTEKFHEANYSGSNYTLKSAEETYYAYFRSEEALLKLLGFASLVCVIISVFGFVSIISLTCEERRREIAIRKVNGVMQSDIHAIFYKEYFLLLLISACITFSAVDFVMKRWIENYTLQTNIPAWIYLSIIALLSVIIVVCIGWKVVKTAKENPAIVIKSE